MKLLLFSFLFFSSNGRPDLYGPNTCNAQDTNLILVNQSYLKTIQEKARAFDSLQSVDKSLPPSPLLSSSVSTPTLKPIVTHKVHRTFQKICPECSTMCVSTNLMWNGGSTVEKFGSVRFICTNAECNNTFSDEIKESIKKSEPMIEIK